MTKEDADPIMDETYLPVIKSYSGLLKDISGERIWSEMSKILMSRKAEGVAKLMEQCGIFENIGMGSLPVESISNIDFSQQMPSCDCDKRVAIILGLLLQHDKNTLYQVCANWKVSKKTKLLSDTYSDGYRDSVVYDHMTELYWAVYRNPEKFEDEHKTRLQYLKFDRTLLERKVVTLEDIQEFEKFTLPVFPFSKEMFALLPNFKSKQKPVIDRLREEWVKSVFNLQLEDMMRMVQ